MKIKVFGGTNDPSGSDRSGARRAGESKVDGVTLAELVKAPDGGVRTRGNVQEDFSQSEGVGGCNAQNALKQKGLVSADWVIGRKAVFDELALVDKGAVCMGKEHARRIRPQKNGGRMEKTRASLNP